MSSLAMKKSNSHKNFSPSESNGKEEEESVVPIFTYSQCFK